MSEGVKDLNIIDNSNEFDISACNIRPYNLNEYKAVLNLWKNHFFEEVHRRPAHIGDIQYVNKRLKAEVPTSIWVATFKDSVIGFLGLTPPENNDGDAPIHVIAIHRSFRRKGVGTQLLSKACESLSSNTYTEWISISDHSSSSFVRKYSLDNGFEEIKQNTFVKSLKGSLYRW